MDYFSGHLNASTLEQCLEGPLPWFSFNVISTVTTNPDSRAYRIPPRSGIEPFLSLTAYTIPAALWGYFSPASFTIISYAPPKLESFTCAHISGPYPGGKTRPKLPCIRQDVVEVVKHLRCVG